MRAFILLLILFQARGVCAQNFESDVCTFLNDFYYQLVKEKTIIRGDSLYIFFVNNMNISCDSIPHRIGFPSKEWDKEFYIIDFKKNRREMLFVAYIVSFIDSTVDEIEIVGQYYFKYKRKKKRLQLILNEKGYI